MRFLDYMRLSSNEEESIFRSLKIDIVESDTEYRDIIDALSLKYQYIKESIDIIDEINKDLKKVYSGKYKYGFCMDESNKTVKMKESYRNKIYEKYFKVNDKFCALKKRFEEELSFTII